jgi:hypothetical protein
LGGHKYDKTLGGKKNDLSLRPWGEVADEFTKRTGLPMTPTNAFVTANRALAKLRRFWKSTDRMVG